MRRLGGCEQDARRFFGELLGLAEIEKPPALHGRGGVWFAAGAQELHVGVEDQFTAARKAHPALCVSLGTLTTLADGLLAAGADVMWDESVPAMRRFYVEDPWGNRIELLEHA